MCSSSKFSLYFLTSISTCFISRCSYVGSLVMMQRGSREKLTTREYLENLLELFRVSTICSTSLIIQFDTMYHNGTSIQLIQAGQYKNDIFIVKESIGVATSCLMNISALVINSLLVILWSIVCTLNDFSVLSFIYQHRIEFKYEIVRSTCH